MFYLLNKSRIVSNKQWILAVFLLAASLHSSAQNIDAAIATYADKYSPEKAYLHYDKPVYSTGETIWFKAYVMSEVIPALETKTFYTDWLDDKGNLLLHTVSPMVDGVTNGQFDIPADYKGQFIHVRAYTRWMLNFDSAFLYTKQIRILGNEPKTVPKIATAPVLQFFPEGGDIIAGVSNKVAFKANDPYGKPVRVKGVVLNNQGKIVDSLRTQHNGMGYVFLLPEKGASYTAKWKDEKNVERTVTLPAVKTDAVSIQVVVAGSNRKFQVNTTPEFAASMDTIHLVGTVFQHEVFRIAKSTAALQIKGTIPVQDLPTGILTITVFDKFWKPLAERITFVNNQEFSFQPEMEVQHWGLNKRARNEIKITVPDNIVANLSVSVTDMAISADSSTNIVSHLLLSSDLKGDIYKPAYYFSSNEDSIHQQLDLVMLTHGWRRIKWQEVLTGKTPKPVYAKDTAYMTLSGNVFGAIPGQLGNNPTVILLVKQKNVQGGMLLVPIKPDGTFNESTTIIFDTAQIYYQFQNKELKQASAQFMTDRLQVPTIRKYIEKNGANFWADTAGNYRHWLMVKEANEIAEKFRVKTLEAVIVKSKGKSPVQVLDEKYASGLFSGGDGYQFDLVNDPFASSAMNIFSYLQGKVAGLQITTGATPSLQWRGGAPQLYLDEIATDASFVSSVNVNDVAYIKVFRPPFMGGFNGANGAIAIYTRKGNDTRQEAGSGLANNKVFGYTPIREFYAPNYSTFNQQNEQRDIRTTLYWNPAVLTSPEKKSTVLTFYNNDVSKAFRVVIEGMTRDGRLAHVEQIME